MWRGIKRMFGCVLMCTLLLGPVSVGVTGCAGTTISGVQKVNPVDVGPMAVALQAYSWADQATALTTSLLAGNAITVDQAMKMRESIQTGITSSDVLVMALSSDPNMTLDTTIGKLNAAKAALDVLKTFVQTKEVK